MTSDDSGAAARPRLTVVLRAQVVKQCPYVGETDRGWLAVTIAGEAPEIHDLGAKISAIAATPGGISHEDFTAAVAALLPPGSSATSSWQTGPFNVEVTATTGG